MGSQISKMPANWPKLCVIPCRNIPQTDSPDGTPRYFPIPSGRVPESGRLNESARSARFSEIYGMSARSTKSLEILLEDEAHQNTIPEESDTYSTLTLVESEPPEIIAMQILDEILHDIMPEIEKHYDESNDSKETDIESDFDDEIPDGKIFVPKLQLDRLLTARSIKSVKSSFTGKSRKSTSKSEKWDWKFLIPGYPWMGTYWSAPAEDPDNASLCSGWSTCS